MQLVRLIKMCVTEKCSRFGVGKTLVFASKEIGPEIYTNKTQYTAMYRDQDAGRSDNIKIENSSLI